MLGVQGERGKQAHYPNVHGVIVGATLKVVQSPLVAEEEAVLFRSSADVSLYHVRTSYSGIIFYLPKIGARNASP